MNKIKVILLLICVAIGCPLSLFSQMNQTEIRQVDSLKKIIATCEEDSSRINTLVAWDNIIYMYDAQLDFDINMRIDSLCDINLKRPLGKKEKLFFLRAKGTALNTIAVIYTGSADYKSALDYSNRSLAIREKLGDKNAMALTLSNIGNIYRQTGDLTKALNACFESLRIQRETDDQNAIAISLNSIGNIYLDQGNIENAIAYYTKSVSVYEKIGETNGIAIANSYNNIGNVYKTQGNRKKALAYLNKGLAIYSKLKDKRSMVVSFTNIGDILLAQNKVQKAIEYFNNALILSREVEDPSGEATSLNCLGAAFVKNKDYLTALANFNKSLRISTELGLASTRCEVLINISNCYFIQKQYVKAIDFGNKALKAANEIGSAFNQRDAAFLLYKSYKYTGNARKAYPMFDLYVATNDSIESEENQKEVIRQEYKYHYDKKATADSVANAKLREIKNAKIAKQLAEIRTKRNQQYLLFGGLALLLLFALFMFNRFKVTARQKKEIEFQKHLVEEKQKEIIDSIRYAKRIQQALLPTNKYIKKALDKK